MDILVQFAEGFIGIFNQGGAVLVSLITGILPTLVVLLTFVNAIIKLVGEERVMNFAKLMTKNIILRYTVFPVLAVFFLTNPMCYTFGQFVEEKQKPAFYDAAVSFVHPILGLFPHANAGELFVWTGIAVGVEQAGESLAPLAIWYFIVGVVVILIRGIVTETLTKLMWKD
jgi:PTS system glucitol/sorbitol-specific IIC component